MLWYNIKIWIIGVLSVYLGSSLYKYLLHPFIVNKCTKDIEVNPKWITPKLQSEYYGFNDMDIVVAESKLNNLPRFRITKDHRLQLLISNDTSTKDIEEVARIALLGRLKIKHNLWYPDKPTHWLSILNFMLDGGDIRQEETSWEKKQDKKPVDLS